MPNLNRPVPAPTSDTKPVTWARKRLLFAIVPLAALAVALPILLSSSSPSPSSTPTSPSATTTPTPKTHPKTTTPRSYVKGTVRIFPSPKLPLAEACQIEGQSPIQLLTELHNLPSSCTTAQRDSAVSAILDRFTTGASTLPTPECSTAGTALSAATNSSSTTPTAVSAAIGSYLSACGTTSLNQLGTALAHWSTLHP